MLDGTVNDLPFFMFLLSFVTEVSPPNTVILEKRASTYEFVGSSTDSPQQYYFFSVILISYNNEILLVIITRFISPGIMLTASQAFLYLVLPVICEVNNILNL